MHYAQYDLMREPIAMTGLRWLCGAVWYKESIETRVAAAAAVVLLAGFVIWLVRNGSLRFFEFHLIFSNHSHGTVLRVASASRRAA